jgi:hypothetical protein
VASLSYDPHNSVVAAPHPVCALALRPDGLLSIRLTGKGFPRPLPFPEQEACPEVLPPQRIAVCKTAFVGAVGSGEEWLAAESTMLGDEHLSADDQGHRGVCGSLLPL